MTRKKIKIKKDEKTNKYYPFFDWDSSTKKHYNHLLSSDRCKSAFLHPPVVAFRRYPNLEDLLVKAKSFPNVKHASSVLLSGSFRCGKKLPNLVPMTPPFVVEKLRYLSLHFPWTNQLHISRYCNNPKSFGIESEYQHCRNKIGMDCMVLWREN